MYFTDTHNRESGENPEQTCCRDRRACLIVPLGNREGEVSVDASVGRPATSLYQNFTGY